MSHFFFSMYCQLQLFQCQHFQLLTKWILWMDFVGFNLLPFYDTVCIFFQKKKKISLTTQPLNKLYEHVGSNISCFYTFLCSNTQRKMAQKMFVTWKHTCYCIWHFLRTAPDARTAGLFSKVVAFSESALKLLLAR